MFIFILSEISSKLNDHNHLFLLQHTTPGKSFKITYL